jgi:PAS domain S-box-containing protein
MIHWQYTPYILPLLAATAISVALAVYAWRRRSAPGVAPFILLMLAVAEWSLASALQLGSTDLAAKLFWSKVRYFGIVVVSTAWLILVLQHTGREKWLTRRNLILLSIEPLVTLLLTWTNEFHHLIWRSIGLEVSGSLLVWYRTHGVAFWIHAAYSYLLLLISILLLVQALIRSPRLYRAQTSALLIGALAPLAANVLSTFWPDLAPVDMTPFAFTVAGAAMAWGLFRLQWLDIVPVARDAVIESLSDGVIVLDAQGRIVDLNPTAEGIIGCTAAQAIGQPVVRVLAPWIDLVERYRDVTEAHDEIALGEGEAQRYFDLRISPVYARRGRLAGRLVVLRDITERKQAEEALRAQKQLFERLVAVARATAERPTLEATLHNALSVATELTGAEHGNLSLLDESGAATRSFLVRGQAKLEAQQALSAQVMDKGLINWVTHHHQTALISDTLHDERWQELPDAPHTARSVLAVPIVSGSILIGILTLIHSQPGHFDTEHAHLMQAAADQMALAVRNAQVYEEQRLLADRQITLYEFLTTVGKHLHPRIIARVAVEAIAQLTDWPAVAVLLPDDAMTHLVIQAAAGDLSVAEGQHIPLDHSVIGRAFRTVQTQHVPDVSADPDYISGHPDIRCELAVPLRRGERVLGVLNLESDQPAIFDTEDLLLAESLAEAVVLALDNARLYEEARQQAADLSTLYTITRMASRSLVLQDALSQTLSAALLSLGFEAGLISLASPSDGRLHLVAEHGLPSILSQRLQQRGMEGTLCAYVHDQQESLVSSDFEQETPAAISKMLAEMAALGLRACACIPLLHKEQSLGVMGLFAHQPRTFSPNEKVLLNTIGHQIATAVANARLFHTIADERGRLQALIESSRDGIIFVGTAQRVLLANVRAVELLQLPGQPEDWIGQSIRDILLALRHHAPAMVGAALAEMRRLKKGDEPPNEGESEVPPRAIHWLSLPVLVDTTPLGRLLVLRDVTKERLLEKMRDDLTHTMVHDLRNPLTSLTLALRLLDQPQADNLLPNQRMMLELALDGAQRILKMTNNILDVSRLESGQMPLESAPVSLADLVAETLRGQALLAAQKNLRLESDVPSMLPPVWADAQLIERVLENLFGNAIRFTPPGGLVKVTAKTVDEAGNGRDTKIPEMHISVSDNGPGISPALQSRLFHKFVTGRQHESGSGLGLVFCRLTVEAHGGRIWIESEPDQGTTITFTLPTVPQHQAIKPEEQGNSLS